MKHPMLTRDKAIRALHELFNRHFGSDKGSDEMYQAFCEDLKICEEWDGESTTNEYLPPSMFEIMATAGVNPDHLTEALHINPLIAEELKASGYL